MCRCVELEHHLLAVTTVLSAHGIASVVLQGGATAHLDYPQPWWREFGDIDLLIDSTNLLRATERHAIPHAQPHRSSPSLRKP